MRVGGLSIAQLCELPISEARDFLADLNLTGQAAQIAGSVLTEINAASASWLTWAWTTSAWPVARPRSPEARPSASAWPPRSAQAWWASSTSWTSPVSVCTSATTPDSSRTLQRLRDLGNTLIVVEHDEDTIRSADWIVDIGPGAGDAGW